MSDVPDDHDDFDPRDADEEDGDGSDCLLMPDGQCLAAGSEWCDWECPMRNSEHFAGSKAWIEKHKKRRSKRRPATPSLPGLPSDV